MEKRKLLLQILLLVSFLLTGCGYAAPEKAVRQELDLIQKLDEPAIRSFVSYENLRLNQSAPLTNDEETTQAVKLFFQNFDYRIRSSSVSGDLTSADVEVDITNLDAKLLAQDLCRAMIRSSVSQNGTAGETVSSFALMKQCLEENTYPSVTTTITVHLVSRDGAWIIQEDAQLEDEIAGGLVSYLSDPYLLSPNEVLLCTLMPFSDFSAQEWSNYLQMDDVFGTGSDLAKELDAELAEQIAAYFSFEILNVTQDGSRASAAVQITSLDMPGVCAKCRQSLLDYAGTTASIRATDEEIAQKTAEYLLEALRENSASTVSAITVELINNGYTWEALLDENFSDALLGGLDASVAILYPDIETP